MTKPEIEGIKFLDEKPEIINVPEEYTRIMRELITEVSLLPDTLETHQGFIFDLTHITHKFYEYQRIPCRYIDIDDDNYEMRKQKTMRDFRELRAYYDGYIRSTLKTISD